MKTLKVLKITLPLICIFVLFSLFTTGEAVATNYYISPTGTDSGDCTIGSPCVTITYASAKVSAGDTLYIRGGTYNQDNITWSASGTSGNPITVKAYTGETPIFDGNGADKFIYINSSTVAYVIFDGLEITDYDYNAFVIYKANNITIKNCNIHDILAISSGAIWIGDASIQTHHITIENNTFENIGRIDQLRLDHVIYPSYNASDITIKNNYFKNCRGGPAISSGYHTPLADYINVYNNIFYLTTGLDRSAIYQDGVNHGYYYNNTIVSDCSAPVTYCEGITSVGSGGIAYAKNNVLYCTSGNCNLMRTAYSGQVVADYNLYYPTKDSDDTGSNSFAGNRNFINPSGYNFRLESDSPAIDTGITLSEVTDDFGGNIRPSGVAYDIGAYEYVGTDITDTTPPAAPKLY